MEELLNLMKFWTMNAKWIAAISIILWSIPWNVHSNKGDVLAPAMEGYFIPTLHSIVGWIAVFSILIFSIRFFYCFIKDRKWFLAY